MDRTYNWLSASLFCAVVLLGAAIVTQKPRSAYRLGSAESALRFGGDFETTLEDHVCRPLDMCLDDPSLDGNNCNAHKLDPLTCEKTWIDTGSHREGCKETPESKGYTCTQKGSETCRWSYRCKFLVFDTPLRKDQCVKPEKATSEVAAPKECKSGPTP